METMARQKLLPEDLKEFQAVEARLRSLRQKPTAYSTAQAEEIHQDHLRTMGDLVERYEIDETAVWAISTYTGRISYK